MNEFYKFTFKMPEVLLKMISVPENSKPNFGLYYSHKATFYDGGYLFNFSFYDVYHPFVKHPLVLHELHIASKFFGQTIDLGSDDNEPLHIIICNSVDKNIQVAKFDEGTKFLRKQYPPVKPIHLTKAQKSKLIEEIKAEIEENKIKLDGQDSWHDSLRKRGMFEMFTNPSVESNLNKERLIRELNKMIGDDLINLYADYFNIDYQNAKMILTQRSK